MPTLKSMKNKQCIRLLTALLANPKVTDEIGEMQLGAYRHSFCLTDKCNSLVFEESRTYAGPKGEKIERGPDRKCRCGEVSKSDTRHEPDTKPRFAKPTQSEMKASRPAGGKDYDKGGDGK